ncbi:MAG: Holliday junction branch migration protein RuvA [Rickettsiales bacterium]|jgi:Holliday junction DNA helicase RuvA|nr:Holliday junction branch migration protein RuvA [Rickettsiales bacterium]
MIGKLQGIIDYIGDGYIILMVGGVGYHVFVPANLQCATYGSQMTLWIETIVREDSFKLFGFESMAQQDLFGKLTSVSGVGPKVGMSIIGSLKANVLLSAIATGDAKTISSAPGVGKKVAEKIIVELKGKTKGFDLGGGDGGAGNNLSDLLSALESLGYRRADVAECAQKLVRENPETDMGSLVRAALKEITK